VRLPPGAQSAPVQRGQSGLSTYTDFIGAAAPTGATPEPASWLLLAGGMALMAVNKFSQRR
jgi:hypothetical protein